MLIDITIINKIIIFTDCEPDDLLFFIILVHFRKHKPIEILIVVGEGDVCKVKGMVTFLKNINYENFKVVNGIQTSRSYPKKIIQLLEKDYDEEIMGKYISYNNYKNEISSFINNDIVLVCCIKAPTELYEMYKENLLKYENIIYSLYGSVNNRWMLSNIMKKELVNFYSKFDQIIWIESYFTIGEDNSVLLQDLGLGDAVLMGQIIMEWNNHIFINDSKRISTNANAIKRLKNISQSDGKQIVMADFLLPIILFDNLNTISLIKGNVEFDDKNFTKINNNSDKINFVSNLDKSEIVNKIKNYVVDGGFNL